MNRMVVNCVTRKELNNTNKKDPHLGGGQQGRETISAERETDPPAVARETRWIVRRTRRRSLGEKRSGKRKNGNTDDECPEPFQQREEEEVNKRHLYDTKNLELKREYVQQRGHPKFCEAFSVTPRTISGRRGGKKHFSKVPG